MWGSVRRELTPELFYPFATLCTPRGNEHFPVRFFHKIRPHPTNDPVWTARLEGVMVWAFEAAACGRERRQERVEWRCFGGSQLGVRRRPPFSHAGGGGVARSARAPAQHGVA
jgi:hypothetical protein